MEVRTSSLALNKKVRKKKLISESLATETFFESWKREFWQSIKAFDTEDKLDLYFFRPMGFLFAKMGSALRLSPTILTLSGMFLGVLSGFFFYAGQEGIYLELASIFFVLAGIFDSADGQLARLTGKFSKVGLVLDGVCDNIVFTSAYVGCTLPLQYFYGPGIWCVAVLAGVCHSAQSAALDFYNREYLYFGCGMHKADYWNPSVDEADHERAACTSRAERIAWWFRRSWLGQQQLLTTRGIALRLIWKAEVAGERSVEFQRLYRNCNRTVLRFWRPLGANVHTIMIILFAAIGRFELYLLFVDIGALMLWLMIMRVVQLRADRKFIRQWRQVLEAAR